MDALKWQSFKGATHKRTVLSRVVAYLHRVLFKIDAYFNYRQIDDTFKPESLLTAVINRNQAEACTDNYKTKINTLWRKFHIAQSHGFSVLLMVNHVLGKSTVPVVRLYDERLKNQIQFVNDSSCSALIAHSSNVKCEQFHLVKSTKIENKCKQGYKHYKPVDCSVLNKTTHGDGVYMIYPYGGLGFEVYCDMKTDGGGWTVFQRRVDGAIGFHSGWTEYEDGFGDVKHEFWLGNAKLHRLTLMWPTELRIDFVNYKWKQGYAKYSRFSVKSASNQYKLNVGGYRGNSGDSLKYHNRMGFSTPDRDNDVSSQNCAGRYQAGWLYKSCFMSNLNGLFNRRGEYGLTCDVTDALIEIKDDFVFWPTDVDSINRIKCGFYRQCNFPNVLGCIDCTHVRIQATSDDEPSYVNRKGYHSINVQAVCDFEGRFINIFANWPGSTHDSHIFNTSTLSNYLQTNHRGLIDGVILGDSGYACRSFLLTPYANPIERHQQRFNGCHASTRSVIERTFGILKRRFHVLHSEVRMKPEKVYRIFGACAVLYNIALSRNEPLVNDDGAGVRLDQPVQVPAFVGVQDGRNTREHVARVFFSN
ncbi:HARBI1 [Mytilus coruscus]|uniref:HARBI1 n=1 Tax=Mytilus coruscus TaxID=42192 RepID=A0A6J8E8Q3_MYTCO|nr:HARBI1 [Mytilus coruscus]